ncbi:hypothetical protein ACFUGD_08365 [Streptomyces sp. NPDC057217]|uniref:hypothetical protein n=1 Tax=unclassified Streptomyces TaxID=2593676 RepID=UPI0036358DFF
MGSCCTPDHSCSTGADGTDGATTGAEPDDTALTAAATADDGAGREPAGRA